MKMTKRERKIYNDGRRGGYVEGFAEGYTKGLHDGNPFIKIAEAVSDAMENITEFARSPEFLAIIEKAAEDANDEQ